MQNQQRPISRRGKADWGKGLRAVCFDAGETLIFDRPTRDERVALALDHSGIRFSSEELGRGLRSAQEHGMAQYLQGRAIDEPAIVAELTRIILEGVGATADLQTVSALATAYAAIPFERYLEPGAIPLLERLRERGFKIGIISDWEPDLPALLEALGCRHLLDAVAVSSIVGATKPSAKIFEAALEQLEVAADEAVHVGDYLELDVAGAQAAGMNAVLYDWRGWHREEDTPAPVVRSFGGLVGLLESVAAARPAPG